MSQLGFELSTTILSVIDHADIGLDYSNNYNHSPELGTAPVLMNPDQFPSCYLKIHFNITLSTKPVSLKWNLYFMY